MVYEIVKEAVITKLIDEFINVIITN